MVLAKISFRVDRQPYADTAAGVVPDIGQVVTIEHTIFGRRSFRVVDVNHQYTDTGARRTSNVLPAPVIVDLEEAR